MDVNVETVDADADVDVMALAMNAWDDLYAVVGFNDIDVDVDMGKLEGNLVQIELKDST